VIIATGVTYRRLGIPSLGPLHWHGGLLWCRRRRSARDDWALHLARFASRVRLLVRGQSLATGMSDYLVTQLEATPNVDVRLRTQLVDGRGRSHLETLTLEDLRTGRREEVHATAVFVLIGAEPRTEWRADRAPRVPVASTEETSPAPARES
jgi:thioredoxin reductase (NADPH)